MFKTSLLKYLKICMDLSVASSLHGMKITTWQELTSGSHVKSKQTTCYRNVSYQTKAWHESTKSIEQKSLTDHEPKRIRRNDGTHVNIASFVNRFSKLGMALTEL